MPAGAGVGWLAPGPLYVPAGSVVAVLDPAGGVALAHRIHEGRWLASG